MRSWGRGIPVPVTVRSHQARRLRSAAAAIGGWAARTGAGAGLAAVALAAQAVPVAPAAERAVAYSARLAGTIDARAEGVLEEAILAAEKRGARLLVLRLDTAGGLAASTTRMVEDILGAPMPVVVYVHPPGAAAGSGGLLLALAADVAAMAPATRIGAATPVRAVAPVATSAEERRIARVLDRKFLNDSAAFARALAEERGRNADLAERMVRDAASASARRALRAGLVDLVADDERRLLAALDGFAVRGPRARRLRTAGIALARADTAVADTLPEDPDGSSFGRSFALLVGAALGIALTAALVLSAPRRWRRRRRRRRADARRAGTGGPGPPG